jgi:DNA-binding NarL/FixJ family response regulator
MPRKSVTVQSSTTSGSAARRRVALVANQGPREEIAHVLEREKLSFDAFDQLETLLGLSTAEYSPCVLLVWVEDTLSALGSDIESVVQRFAPTPTVVICSRIERWEVRAALTAGAAGVVLSSDLDSALIPCIDAVRSGQICVPRQHWRQIEPPVLSSREKQILGLVVMGYMNGQIAEQLFLAESTVKSHLSSAFGKLGVRSRNEAVDLIINPERGLGMGILGLGGEPVETTPAPAQ